MNQLTVRKGPKFEYVPEGYASEFEEHVILAYMRAGQDERIYGRLPMITENIMFAINPVFHAAGIAWSESDNPDAFKEHAAATGDDEVDLAMELIEDMTSDDNIRYYQANNFDGLYHDDVAAVLQHHHMCFVDVIPQMFHYQPELIIMNSPIVQVF